MKILLLIFFLISCSPAQEEQLADSSSKPEDGRPKAERVPEGETAKASGEGEQAKVDTAPSQENQPYEEVSSESPPAPLSVSVCDRTPAVREFLIAKATPLWRRFWWDIPCEDLNVKHLENIHYMSLHSEGITHFKAGDFADLPALTILNLPNNSLSNIGAHWFSELRNLENLNLARNRINQFDLHAFAGLNKLRRLILKDNKIENLSTELIAHLTFLESIDLSNNALRILPENFFDGFQYLTNVNLQNNLFEGSVNCGVSPPGIDRLCKY